VSAASDAHVARVAAAFPEDWPLLDHLLVAGYVGSESHGTYMPGSHGGLDDVDIMGIIVPPPRYLIGLSTFEHWTLIRDELDIVTYAVSKFARLLLKGNPNVLGLLWLPERAYLYRDPLWAEFWEPNRSAFLSQRVYDSFVGYALSQLRRLGKPNTRGYMGKDRKALFERFSYDVKNAAHCVRLLRMGLELLETGELHVDRTGIDADELRAIKRGEYSLAHIEQLAEDGFRRMAAARAQSSLPPEPDTEVTEAILMATIEHFWNR
jgi:uncharacterized protein